MLLGPSQLHSSLYHNLLTRETFLSFFNFVSYRVWNGYLRLAGEIQSLSGLGIGFQQELSTKPRATFWKGMCQVALSNWSTKLQKEVSPAAALCMLLSFFMVSGENDSNFSLAYRPHRLEAFVLNPNSSACCKCQGSLSH